VNGRLHNPATQHLEKEDLLLVSQKDGWTPHWPGRADERKNCHPRRGPKPNSLFLQPERLHYTTLHYTTRNDTTLHCNTLNCTTLHCTAHYTALHYTTLHTTLHYTALHYTLHYTTLHYTLHYTTLQTTLHYRANNILSYLNTALLHVNTRQTPE